MSYLVSQLLIAIGLAFAAGIATPFIFRGIRNLVKRNRIRENDL